MKSIVKLTFACNLRGKINLCVAFHATTISFVKACTTKEMIIYMSHSMLE
jgi:hypothetical protein